MKMDLPKNFILSNVNVFEGDILLCDSYIPEVAPEFFSQLSAGKSAYHFAPELTHIDQLGFKLCTVLRIGKVRSMTVFTKDGSPHGLQVPLVVQEAVENIGFEKSRIHYFVWEKGTVYEISDAAVRKARHLSEIEILLRHD
jgi:hypothetical protein